MSLIKKYIGENEKAFDIFQAVLPFVIGDIESRSGDVISPKDILNDEGLEYEYYKPIFDRYVKAVNNYERVSFSNLKQIIENRFSDEAAYNNLLSKFNLVDHQLADSNNKSLLYFDLKMQLLAKIINKEIGIEDAKELGYIRNDTINPIQHIDINSISDKTVAFGVELNKGGAKTMQTEAVAWQKTHPNGIVAYRKYKDTLQTFTPSTVSEGWIGNPFSTEQRGATTVQQFYDWLTTGNNFNNPRATEEFRQAIIQKILDTPEGTPVFYYTELNRPSHATVIGYLVNNKQLLQPTTAPQNISQGSYTVLQDASSLLTEEPAAPVQQNIEIQQVPRPSIIYNTEYAGKSLGMQLRDIRYKMSPALKLASVRMLGNDFYKYISFLESNFNAMLLKKAKEQNISIGTARIRQERINKRLMDSINTEMSFKNPDMSFVNKLKMQIIPLNFVDVIKLYGINTLEKKQIESIRKKSANNPELNLILENYDALFREAASWINRTYGINILGNLELYDNQEEGDDETNPEDVSNTEHNTQGEKEDYSHADDKTKATELSLTRELKLAFTECYLTQKDGVTPQVDALGRKIPVDVSAAHNKILHLTLGMIDESDLIPMLERSSEGWVKQFVEKLKSDERLRKQAYYTYKLSAQNYAICYYDRSKKKMSRKDLNRLDNAEIIANETRANIENGIIQTSDPSKSVFDKIGNVNKEYIQSILDSLVELRDELVKANVYENVQDIDFRIENALRTFGISITGDFNIKEALTIYNSTNNIKTNATSILDDMVNICKTLVKDIKDSKDDIPFSRFNETYYKNLYKLIGAGNFGYVESSITEAGKTFYTYAKTNYFDEMLLKMKQSVKGKKAKDGSDYYIKWQQDHFGKSDFFLNKANNRWRSPWLRKLFDNTPNGDKYRNLIERCQVLYSSVTGRKLDYVDWDYTTSLVTNFVMYSEADQNDVGSNNEKKAWYRMPIASDSPAGDYLKFTRYVSTTDKTYDDLIIDDLWDVLLQELVRIKDVRNHLENKINGNSNIEDIKDYDAKIKEDTVLSEAGGLVFTMMPQLNYIKINPQEYSIFEKLPESEIEKFNGLSFYDTIQTLMKKKQEYSLDISDLKTFFKQVYLNWFEKDFENEFENALPILQNNLKIKDENKLRERYREYSMNFQLAFTQMVELTSTDMAFFGKREVEEVNSQKDADFSVVLNNKIRYYKIISDTSLEQFQKRNKEYHAPSNKIASRKDSCRVVYLKDIEITSEIYKNIEKIVKDNPKLSPATKKRILEAYKKVNVADGQSYRTLSSYVELLKDSGKLDKETEVAFNRIIQTKQWNEGDLSLITLAIKPYVYTTLPFEREIGGVVMAPTQHKNSEFPLLVALGAISAELNNSPQLNALNRFMRDYNIDIAHFNSVVKVSDMGSIKIDGQTQNEEEVYQQLVNRCQFDKFENGNPQIIKEIPSESWGIQTNKPEHLIDHTQLFGSQARRLVLADIPEDAEFVINGEKYDAKQFKEHFQKLITANILEKVKEVDDIFKNPRELSKFLQESVASSNKYDNDLIEMFIWDEENNRFNIPFWDQTTANRVEELLLSLVKNRIAKQKIKGGSAVQTAAVGLSKKLNVRYKDSNGNLIPLYSEWKEKNPDKNDEEYEQMMEGATVAYMECYLPLWSKDLMEKFINEDGSINNKDFPDELRKIIGYRVPTEDHYSMAPLRVVGFMPNLGASSIILPADITVIAGSDFDIDTLYLLLHEYKISRYDEDKLFDDYQKAKDRYIEKSNDSVVNNLIRVIFKGSLDENDDLTPEFISYKRWRNKHLFDTDRNDNPKYLLPKDKWTVKKIEYDRQKDEFKNSRKARNNEIIDCMYACLTSKHSLEKFSNPGNYEPQKIASRICDILANPNNQNSLRTLMGKTLDELNDIYTSINKGTNIASPETASVLHQQNMTGKKLVGIFAVGNAILQLIQQNPISVNYNHFTINYNESNKDWVIGKLRNKDGELITKQLASYLAAAVDNGKDPIMKSMFIDSDTANDVIYLTMLGYTPLEIGLFLRCALNPNYLSDEEYKDLKLPNDVSALKLDTMADALRFPESMEARMTFARARRTYDVIKKNSALLSCITQTSRADSIGGGVSKDLISNIIKYEKQQTFFDYNLVKGEEDEPDTYKFSKLNDKFSKPILPILDITFDNIEDIGDWILNRVKIAGVPYLEAFTDGTINASNNWMKPYSLMLTEDFYNNIIVNITKDGYINPRLVSKLMSDMQAYWLMHTKLFGKESNMSIIEKRKYYLESFPQEFALFKANLPEELKDNAFINNIIYVSPGTGDNFNHLEVRELGKSKFIREKFKNDFDVLADFNPDIALKLFVYTTFRNGFNYSQTGWAHLISTQFKRRIPEYVDVLYDMKNMKFGDFFEQFVRNNFYTFKSLTEDYGFMEDEDWKSIVSRKPLSSQTPTVTFYIRRNNKLFKGYRDVKGALLYVEELKPLGRGKFYHEYDFDGGISAFDDQNEIANYDNEDDGAFDPNDMPEEAFSQPVEKTNTSNATDDEGTNSKTVVEETNDRSNPDGIPSC